MAKTRLHNTVFLTQPDGKTFSMELRERRTGGEEQGVREGGGGKTA